MNSGLDGKAQAETGKAQATGGPAQIIDGQAIARSVLDEQQGRIDALERRGITPGLTVILVGQDDASAIYVRNKERACRKLGIASEVIRLPADTTQQALLARIDGLNADDAVDGILVQLPLPRHLDADTITDRIRADKDVDGFGTASLGLLAAGRPQLVACTPAGVMRMLTTWALGADTTLVGRHAVVIGRSVIVGRPMALALLGAHCTVTICHSRTVDLAAHVGRADIVVAAAGVPELVRGEWLAPGAVVVDVGMHRRADGGLCGDVHFESARRRARAISPVPKGVGPMTVAMLMANTVQACEQRRGA